MVIAFEYLDISILLEKLNYYGIRGVGQTWVADYLYDRSQKVSSGNTSASTLYLKHQCSTMELGLSGNSDYAAKTLGPLKFLIYYNALYSVYPALDYPANSIYPA